MINSVWAESTQPLSQPTIPSSSQQLLFSKINLRTNTINFSIYSSTSYPSPTTTHLMACICSALVVSDERGICRNRLKCDVEVPVGWYNRCSAAAAAAVGGISRDFRKNTNRRFVLFRKSREEPVCLFLPIHLIVGRVCDNISLIDEANISHFKLKS